MRALGVDFGEKRVGIALSDATGLIASPRGVLNRHSNQQVAEQITGLVSQHDITVVVVGLPLDADGEEGYQARRVRRFAEILETLLLDVPLVYWDESLSSVDAEQALRQAGARKKRRRGPTDDVAAAVLLQAYLDTRPAEDRT